MKKKEILKVEKYVKSGNKKQAIKAFSDKLRGKK